MNGPSRCMGVASLTVCAVFAQAPAAPPAFDVASVKPCRSDPRTQTTRSWGDVTPRVTLEHQFHQMLQNLLAERFHLVFHRETRNFPGYELVVDKGGPKFKEVTPTPDANPGSPPRRAGDGRRSQGLGWFSRRSRIARVQPGQ